MNAAMLRDYAERLEATGLSFARLDRDPGFVGVRHTYKAGPWDAAILRLANATGWTIVDERVVADPAQLRIEP